MEKNYIYVDFLEYILQNKFIRKSIYICRLPKDRNVKYISVFFVCYSCYKLYFCMTKE